MISIEFIDICRDSVHAYSIIKQRKKILFTPSQSKLTNLKSDRKTTVDIWDKTQKVKDCHRKGFIQ